MNWHSRDRDHKLRVLYMYIEMILPFSSVWNQFISLRYWWWNGTLSSHSSPSIFDLGLWMVRFNEDENMSKIMRRKFPIINRINSTEMSLQKWMVGQEDSEMWTAAESELWNCWNVKSFPAAVIWVNNMFQVRIILWFHILTQ